MASDDVLALVGTTQLSRWNVAAPVGTPIVVTYSFAETLADYASGYYSGFQSFNDTHRAYTRTALDTWAAAGGIEFVEVPDSLGGQIRFSFIDMSGMLNATGNPLSGFAYYPGYSYSGGDPVVYSPVDDTIGGDVFMNASYYASDASTMAPGIRGYSILIHEIGHALGFKHPFEGDPTINPAHDHGVYTVMSYDRSRSTTELGTVDVEALRHYYGESDFAVAFDSIGHVLTLTGTSAGEWMLGTELDDVISGLGGDDTLRGEWGNDTLDGGAGVDALDGGTGDDTYIVDNAGDTITEAYGAGTDTVRSSIDFTLGNNLENLTFTGTGNFSGTGNDLDNILIGGAGFDTLVGGAGNDRIDGGSNPTTQGDILLGGLGNDTYLVDSALDLVDEGIVFGGAADGTDEIISTADFFWDFYSAGDILRIAEGANDPGNDGTTGVGSVFSNTLIGNSGTNVLFGRGGADTYRAGDGIDFMSLSLLGLTEANAYAGVDGVNTVIVEQRSTGLNSYDIIFEFEAGKDKVNVADYSSVNGLSSGADVVARAVDDGIGNSYIALGDGLDYVYMVGLEKADLQAGDFIVA